MDNQQVKEVAYIAGLIDGEGTLCLEYNEWRGNKGRYTARFSLGVTNQAVACKLRTFLERHDIRYYETKRIYPEPYLPVYSIEVKRLTAIWKLLNLIVEDLVGKKRQAELLIKFVGSRLDENGNVIYRGQSKTGFSYAPWVRDIWLELRVLNGRSRPKADRTSSKLARQLSNLNDSTSSVVCRTLTPKIESPPLAKAEA